MVTRVSFLLLTFALNWISLKAQDGIFHAITGEDLTDQLDSLIRTRDFDFFEDEAPLELTLSTDYKKLIKEKDKDQYQPALLKYQPDDTLLIQKEIRVKARVAFRKNYCQFPPIILNFKHTEFRVESLQTLKSLKLVTNCRYTKTYEQYILKEYLAYRVLNVLTDKSFKVRLIRITYEDTSGKFKPNTRFAFIIEEAKSLAARHHAVLYDKQMLSPKRTQWQHMILVDLFQYMIGNTDWSVPGLHNIKLIKIQDLNEPSPYAIPYDFDYTGLVNTIYAVPPEILPIESVTQRLYRGFCPTPQELNQTLEIFKDYQQEILELYANSSYLDSRHRKEAINYLNEFFNIIDQPNRVKKNILQNCRK